MRSFLIGSVFLNTWFLVGGAVWVGLEAVALLEIVWHLGVGFKASRSLCHFKVTLCASCLMFKVRALSFQLQLPCYLPAAKLALYC